MWNRLKQKLKPDVKPLNTIEISKSNILHNMREIAQCQPNWHLFPVLKSNAYGHGILQMLEIFKGSDFPYLAVDSFPEWQMIMRNSHFKVLMIAETNTENYRFFDFQRTAFAVYTIETLKFLAEMKKEVSIHLFLNTGMNREGIQEDQIETFISLFKAFPQLKLEGIFSHLHSADTDPFSVQKQIALFKQMAKRFEDAGFEIKRKHIAASAGILQIQDDYFNACRPGLISYGYSPFEEENFPKNQKKTDLKPALSLYSTII